MLNVGLWGAASTDPEAFVRDNQDLETRLTELGGRKVLYSHTYYTEEEFWKLYDQQWYQELRQRYSATTLPTVYDKVKVDVVRQRQKQMGNLAWLRGLGASWPFAGFVGIWYAIKSRDYLIHRRPCWTYWKSAEKMP